MIHHFLQSLDKQDDNKIQDNTKRREFQSMLIIKSFILFFLSLHNYSLCFLLIFFIFFYAMFLSSISFILFVIFSLGQKIDYEK